MKLLHPTRRNHVPLGFEHLEDRTTPAVAVALSGLNLVAFDTSLPTSTQTTAITNVDSGETLVGIDFRPQNGHLYGLGVNTTGSGTLYDISTRTGHASPIGATGSVTPTAPLPNPTLASSGFGFDFNPVVDKIRVITSSGQSFVVDQNTGLVTTNNGNLNGATTTGSGTSYTNNQPNAPATTLYTIDSASDTLYLQIPATGLTTAIGAITVSGTSLDFSSVNGFDIPTGVNVTTSGTPVASGLAYTTLTASGATQLYTINLTSGAATMLGTIGTGTAVNGLAIQNDYGGFPAIGFSAAVPGAANLVRFNTSTPGTTVTVPLSGLDANDTIVGIDFRPQTGQFYGLGVNTGNGNGTIYRIDPQSCVATAVGAVGSVDVAAPLPNPVTGFGFTFDPTVDAIRVVTNAGQSFTVNPNTGTVVASSPIISGATTSVDAAAYTNSFGQDTGGVNPTTLYVLDSFSDTLYLQNAGTSTLTTVAPIKLNGSNLNFGAVTGFDIPAGVTSLAPSGTPVTSGFGYTALVVGGTSTLYRINLMSGEATSLGTFAVPLAGLALGDAPESASSFLSPNLIVGGANGVASVFLPNPAGQYGTPAATITPFAGFTGQVRTTPGDIDGDGTDDTILVTGPSTPIRVAVISGADHTTVLVAPYDPFGGNFTGGGFVAAADLDGDGRAEFAVTPDQGGGPRITIFSLIGGVRTQRANFFGIDDTNFRGGARAAFGDVNGDGTPDLIACAGFLGGPRTAIFNGTTLFGTPTRMVGDFFAFPGTDAVTLRNGVFVASGDVNGDGFADLIFGGGPGGAPRVFILSGALVSANNVAGAQAAPIANFFVAGNTSDRGGVRVAAKDSDGDVKADVAVGSGEGSPAKVRTYLGLNFTGTSEPGTFQDIAVFGGGALPGGVFVG